MVTATMIDKFSLQTLFVSRMAAIEAPSDLELVVKSWLDQQPFSMENVVEGCYWHETLMSTEKAIENWRSLLTVNLLNHFLASPVKELAAKVRAFEQQPWNQNSQYFRVIVALNHLLTKMSVPEVGSHLLESGAALIDLQEYCSWQALPYAPYHLEFGIFLCILALLTKREDLLDSVIRLAKWQLNNTLDANYFPFTALFTREHEGDPLNTLLLYYLFFHCVSVLTTENEFDGAASALLDELQKNWQDVLKPINPLWVLVEKLFVAEKKEASLPFPLPEHIYDSSTALVGYRSSNLHAVCTLHGGHTGLGSVKLEDVEIINYGPQYLPLGDCFGFGIEGNHLSDHGLRKSMIELRRQGFSLKGCVRLVDQPSSLPFQIGRFRGIWFEILQELKQARFNLKTSFLGLDGWEGTAFSFFAKADKCRVGDEKILLPSTFDRYEGNVQPIYLDGKHSSLCLSMPSFKGTIQAIPLGGKSSFWGANFLIAYILHSDQRHYQWQMESFNNSPCAKSADEGTDLLNFN